MLPTFGTLSFRQNERYQNQAEYEEMFRLHLEDLGLDFQESTGEKLLLLRFITSFMST